MELESQLLLFSLLVTVRRGVLAGVAASIPVCVRSNIVRNSWTECVPNLFSLQFCSSNIWFLLPSEHVGLVLTDYSLEAFLRIIQYLLGPSVSYHGLVLGVVGLSNVWYSVSKVDLLHLLLCLRNDLSVLGRHNSEIILLPTLRRSRSLNWGHIALVIKSSELPIQRSVAVYDQNCIILFRINSLTVLLRHCRCMLAWDCPVRGTWRIGFLANFVSIMDCESICDWLTWALYLLLLASAAN